MYYITGKSILVETNGEWEYSHVPTSFHETLEEAEAAIIPLRESLGSDTDAEEFFVGCRRFLSETDPDDYDIIVLGIHPKNIS